MDLANVTYNLYTHSFPGCGYDVARTSQITISPTAQVISSSRYPSFSRLLHASSHFHTLLCLAPSIKAESSRSEAESRQRAVGVRHGARRISLLITVLRLTPHHQTGADHWQPSGPLLALKASIGGLVPFK